MHELVKPDPHLTFGLRFRYRDRVKLREIGNEAQRHGQGDVSLYFKAAESAEVDEPLVVKAESRDEVEQMAALFTTLGLSTPGIEVLNGR